MRYFVALVLVLAWGWVSPAEARHHHYHHGHPAYVHESAHARDTGRPGAWCGWWMRHNSGRGDPGASFNLARNWARWGSPSAVVPGAIVVYPHHVVRVVAVLGHGAILAISGNDGHAVRTRPRSLAGAIAVRG